MRASVKKQKIIAKEKRERREKREERREKKKPKRESRENNVSCFFFYIDGF